MSIRTVALKTFKKSNMLTMESNNRPGLRLPDRGFAVTPSGHFVSSPDLLLWYKVGRKTWTVFDS